MFLTNNKILESLNKTNFTRLDSRQEMKQDPDGNWLMTVDVNVGALTAQDVNHFNK